MDPPRAQGKVAALGGLPGLPAVPSAHQREPRAWEWGSVRQAQSISEWNQRRRSQGPQRWPPRSTSGVPQPQWNRARPGELRLHCPCWAEHSTAQGWQKVLLSRPGLLASSELRAVLEDDVEGKESRLVLAHPASSLFRTSVPLCSGGARPFSFSSSLLHVFTDHSICYPFRAPSPEEEEEGFDASSGPRCSWRRNSETLCIFSQLDLFSEVSVE